MKAPSTHPVQQFRIGSVGPMQGQTHELRIGLHLMDKLLSHVNSLSHMLAAFWLFAIAVVICLDVSSRALFNAPFTGTAEIVANSIVSIVFLQLPSAVRSGGMLRAEILDIYLSPAVLNRIHAFGCGLGAILFGAVAFSAWAPMVEAWSISEYAGNESTVEIPLSPIRTLLVLMSILAAVNFLLMALDYLKRPARGGARHG